MRAIQYEASVWAKFIIILIYIGLAWPSQAQTTPVTFTLLSKDTPHKALDFYIVNVLDKRKQPGKRVGQVIHLSKATDLMLHTNLESALFTYFKNQAPEHREGQLPLYLEVETYQIQESRIAPNKVSGEARIKINFKWYRNMQAVQLTSFESKAAFTRPETKELYSDLLPSLLDQSIVHFEKWRALNAGKNPALTRKLVLKFKNLTGSDSKDTLFYSPSRPLKWVDFKGPSSRPGSRYAAAVFTSFAYEGNAYPSGDSLIIEIGLKVFMVKPNSWARLDARSANTLRHEQLHFDLTKLAAEAFKERLLKADLTIEDYDSEIQYQFIEAFRNMNRDQEAYDASTGHGTIGSSQATWDDKISLKIKKLYTQN